jgi:hypothetical protein
VSARSKFEGDPGDAREAARPASSYHLVAATMPPRTLGCTLLMLLTACPAPQAVPVSPAPPVRPLRCADEPPRACPYGLEVHPVAVPVDVPTPEEVWRDRSAHRVRVPTTWPTGRGARVIERAGRRFAEVDVAAAFGAWLSGGRTIEHVYGAENGAVIGLVAESWVRVGDSDLAFATLGRDGRLTPARRLSSGPSATNWWTQIVAAPGGRFAVAWQRKGDDPQSTLEIAIVDASGALARSPGLPLHDPGYGRLVGAGDGFVYLYATGEGAGPLDRRGMWAVWLDGRGIVRAHERVVGVARDETAGKPSGAWDGSGVVVAFGLSRSLVVARLGGPGEILTPPTVLESSGDRSASFHVWGVVPTTGGAWISAQVAFQTSVVSEDPEASRVLFVTADGRHTPPLATGEGWLSEPFAFEASSGGVLEIVRDRERAPARAFLATCRASQAPQSPRIGGSCDALERPHALGRFEPLRRGFVAASLGEDLAVLYTEPEDGGAGSALRLARLRPDGMEAWATDVAGPRHEMPSMAVLDDAVAVVSSEAPSPGGQPLSIATFDARTGEPRDRRRFDGARGCAGRVAGGYVVVASHEARTTAPPALGRLTGRSSLLRVADGVVTTAASLPYGAWSCAWLATPRGYLLAFGNDEGFSEHFPLRVQAFDARLAPIGEPRMVEQRIVRRPLLLRVGTRNVALWTGPLERGLYTVDLGDDGAPLGPMRVVARSDGLLGYGLVVGAGEPTAIYANELAIGERRLCSSDAGPTPRLPAAHAEPLPCAR